MLRGPQGCPWDREQTHASLCPYVLEEAREVVAAVDAGTPAALCDELGDLLLQVLLHACLAEEAGAFRLDDVLAGLEGKLIRRHPHVFAREQAVDARDAQRLWEDAKRAEGQGQDAGLLAQVPRAGGALAEAQALGRRAATAGFDWPAPRAAWEKVEEERVEFLDAWAEAAKAAAGGPTDVGGPVEEELGDLLLALASAARLLGLDAERTLAKANDKFRRRFAVVEAAFGSGGADAMRRAGPAARDRAWRQAKVAAGGAVGPRGIVGVDG